MSQYKFWMASARLPWAFQGGPWGSARTLERTNYVVRRGRLRGSSSAAQGRAPPLLQAPQGQYVIDRNTRILRLPDKAEPVVLNTDCGIDLDSSSVTTISVVGPSRRGKSVLAGLLAGGDPRLFPQSHSSFRGLTSGTYICEVGGPKSEDSRLRVVDSEGLSHAGRSRKSEALVRQFLIATYLTSSWVIWLDSEVLSSSFFNTLWLVHDYVVDVLRVKDAAGARLPRLMYVRTQETEVQKLEYEEEFTNFSDFFKNVLESHEDAYILTQMFGSIHGHSLPVWTKQDLSNYGNHRFWDADGHTSPFKDALSCLRDRLLDPELVTGKNGPPLLAFNDLLQHLPKIAKLEAFDPRDHEATKVVKIRNYLRASYGRLVPTPTLGGAGRPSGKVDIVGLINLFDIEDKEVLEHDYQLDQVVRQRLDRKCAEMRVDPNVALADKEVMAVLGHFGPVAKVLTAAVDAFARPGAGLAEWDILQMAITSWRLDAELAAAELKKRRLDAEAQFLETSGLEPAEMCKLRLHEQYVEHLDVCVLRLRGNMADELRVVNDVPMPTSPPPPAVVWRLGEWRVSAGMKPRGYALLTDGTEWALYEEHEDTTLGVYGVLRERGSAPDGEALPVPELPDEDEGVISYEKPFVAPR